MVLVVVIALLLTASLSQTVESAGDQVCSATQTKGQVVARIQEATTPCTINVQGTTLEQPPSQPNGGAFNSTWSSGTVTLGTPLANGASINIRLLFGIQQTGSFKFYLNIEALP